MEMAMTKNPRITGVLTVLAASLLLFLSGVASAQTKEAATVTHLAGILSAQKADGQKRLLGIQSTIEPGEILTTEKDTYARLKFSDGAEVVLRPNSQIRIDDFKFNPAKPEQGSMVFSMLRGGLRAITGLIGKKKPENVHMATPTATIGIRGTHWGALLCQNDCGGVNTPSGTPPANGLHLDVAEGSIVVSNQAGQIQLNAGQFGFVPGANAIPQTLPPQTGIRITIPPSISRNQGSGQGIGNNRNTECIAQ